MFSIPTSIPTSSTAASVNLRGLVQGRGSKPSLAHLVPPLALGDQF